MAINVLRVCTINKKGTNFLKVYIGLKADNVFKLTSSDEKITHNFI